MKRGLPVRLAILVQLRKSAAPAFGAEIAMKATLEPTTVRSEMVRLHRLGLVRGERCGVPGFRRRFVWSLTDEARRVLKGLQIR